MRQNGYARPIYGPFRLGDIRQSQADISRAEKLLGYIPVVDLEQGLRLAIEWYKQKLSPASTKT